MRTWTNNVSTISMTCKNSHFVKSCLSVNLTEVYLMSDFAIRFSFKATLLNVIGLHKRFSSSNALWSLWNYWNL